MKSTAFNVQIFTKLINDQQNYIPNFTWNFTQIGQKIGVMIIFCIKARYSWQTRICEDKYSLTRGTDEWSTSCSGPFNNGKELPVLTGHMTASLGTLVKRKSNLSYSDYSQAPSRLR